MEHSFEARPANAESGAPHSTRAEWDRIAPGYDRTNTVTQMALGEVALRRARLEPGMRFLDVASGSGALSTPAARLGAHVVAVDQSPVMLELLAARAERENLPVECRAMNGEALELKDGEFDIAGSQFGVMLFPDMPKGIREMARVVRLGGRVLMVAYGNPHQIDFLSFFVRAVQAVRPGFEGPPDDPPPLPFQLQDPRRLEKELSSAGLADVNVVTVTEKTAFGTGKELWEWIIGSNPIVEEVLEKVGISRDEWPAIEQAMEVLVRQRAGNDDVAVLTNPVNIGIGTRGE
ncbi:MAG TPA: methyltransferase domain-containing protein [Steroidobacter sp.]